LASASFLSKFQNLALRFPGLYMTKLILPTQFQDVPGPNSFSRTFQVLEILQTKFQDFPGPSSFPRTFHVLEILQTQFQDVAGGVGSLMNAQ